MGGFSFSLAPCLLWVWDVLNQVENKAFLAWYIFLLWITWIFVKYFVPLEVAMFLKRTYVLLIQHNFHWEMYNKTSIHSVIAHLHCQVDRLAPKVNPWVYFWGCFQRVSTVQGRPSPNVGSTMPCTGVPDWIKMTKWAEHQPSSLHPDCRCYVCSCCHAFPATTEFLLF